MYTCDNFNLDINILSYIFSCICDVIICINEFTKSKD